MNDIEIEIRVRNYNIFFVLQRETGLERCGLLLGKRSATCYELVRFIEVPNIHPDRENFFRMSDAHIQKAMRRTRLSPLGYWHTHVHDDEEDPSPKDIEQMARYPNLIGLVYHQPSGTVTWFNHLKIIKKEWVW